MRLLEDPAVLGDAGRMQNCLNGLREESARLIRLVRESNAEQASTTDTPVTSEQRGDDSERAALADSQTLRVIEELRAQRVLRRAYEKLVPDKLAAAAGPPPATVRIATALLTDVRGFTGIAERFQDDPAGLLEIMNEHLAVVVRAIAEAGGVVEKFVGDGVLATFGARHDLPDHAERALAASLGVVNANNQLNRRRAEAWGFALEVGLGAATGRIVGGALGPPERWELGVLGDPINIAARLVAEAGPGEVLLASSTYEGVADKVRADLLGERAVRGRIGRISVYRVALVAPRRAAAWAGPEALIRRG